MQDCGEVHFSGEGREGGALTSRTGRLCPAAACRPQRLRARWHPTCRQSRCPGLPTRLHSPAMSLSGPCTGKGQQGRVGQSRKRSESYIEPLETVEGIWVVRQAAGTRHCTRPARIYKEFSRDASGFNHRQPIMVLVWGYDPVEEMRCNFQALKSRVCTPCKPIFLQTSEQTWWISTLSARKLGGKPHRRPVQAPAKACWQ